MKRYGRYLYEVTIAYPLCLALLILAPRYFGLFEAEFGTAIYAALACAAYALIRHLRGRDRLLAVGAIAAVLLLPVFHGLLFGAPGYFSSRRPLWLVPLAAAGCFLAAMACRAWGIARATCAAVVIGGLVFLMVTEREASKFGVMLLFTVLLLLFADATQVHWRKSGETDHVLHLPFVAPFVVVWLCIGMLFPVSSEPYDWKFARNLWERLQEFGISWSQRNSGSADDFERFRPGFADAPDVRGGTVTDDGRVLMRVRPVSGYAETIRLAGQYCDTFENMSWKATVSGDTGEFAYDSLETRCAFSLAERAADYISEIEVQVTFHDFSSRFVFTPDRLNVRRNLLSELGAEASGRNLMFAKRKGIDDSYSVSGLRMNTQNEVFAEFMKSRPQITAEDWERIAGNSGNAGASYGGLPAYRNRMRECYCRPFALTEDAAAFVAEAAGEETEPFARMLAIGKTLSEFSYTIAPGMFPESVRDEASFLSYFLSERRGYCTHFATAMVFFAWSEGLPARFVEGFSVPLKPRENVDVTADMAHAWCEIYFEGVGWIPFDVTPGHGTSEYWLTFEQNYSAPVQPREVTPVPTKAVNRPSDGTGTKSSAASRANRLSAALLAVFAIPLLAALVLGIDRLFVALRCRRMSDAERIPVLLRRNLRVLRYLGLPMEDAETFAEYAGRIRGKLPPEATDWIAAYEAYLYGPRAGSSAADAKSRGDAGTASTRADAAVRSSRETASAMAAGNAALVAVFAERMPRKYRLCKYTNRLLR